MRRELTEAGRRARWAVPLLVGFAALAYLSSGTFRVELGQQALRTRFGRLEGAPLGPGVHYHLPAPFGSVRKVSVKRVRDVPLARESAGATAQGLQYLSGDENLVLVQGVVQYDVVDLTRFVLLQSAPRTLVRELAIAALARIVARHAVDDIFTSRKVALQAEARRVLQERLDALQSGVRVISFSFTEVAPPRAVADAFHKVSSAREEGRKLASQAQGYANDVLPRARGRAGAIVSEARARRSQMLDRAHAEVSSFEELLKEYRKTPEITRREQYHEAMRRILSRVQVVLDPHPDRSTYLIGKDVQLLPDAGKPW